MTLIIDFAFSEDWNVNNLSSLSKINKTELRYYYFLGDIIIRDDKNDLSALWKWIPIFDFGICLFICCKELHGLTSRSFIDFTESDEQIEIKKNKEHIIISSTYSNLIIETQFLIFKTETKKNLAQLEQKLLNQYPDISESAFAKNMFAEWNSF